MGHDLQIVSTDGQLLGDDFYLDLNHATWASNGMFCTQLHKLQKRVRKLEKEQKSLQSLSRNNNATPAHDRNICERLDKLQKKKTRTLEEKQKLLQSALRKQAVQHKIKGAVA